MEGVRNRFGYGVNLDFLSHMIDLGRVNLVTFRAAATTAKQVFRIKTGPKVLHFIAMIKTGAAFPYKFYEGVTISTAGTELTKVNPKRRAKAETLGAQFFSGATYTGGTELKVGQSGFGTNQGQASSGEANEGFYWELLPDTEYVVDGTPGASTDVLFESLSFETEV